MKRIAFFASFIGALFFFAGMSYFFLLPTTKASLEYPDVPTEIYEYSISACNTYGCSANSNIISTTRSSGSLDTSAVADSVGNLSSSSPTTATTLSVTPPTTSTDSPVISSSETNQNTQTVSPATTTQTLTVSNTVTAPLPVNPPVASSSTAEKLSPVVAEISQPESYRQSEDLLRQKYQEAESVFRKENSIPSGRVVAGEEKRKIVEEIHSQFPVLAPAADFVLLGTTTISRITDSERVIAEVSRIIANRNETSTLIDADADNLSDYDETHIYGTNPKNFDTDGDGIKDGDEILTGTDPLKKAIVPVSRENPKEIVFATKTDSKIFSVQKIVVMPAPQNASSTETVQLSLRVAFEGTGLPNSFVTLYIFSTPIIVTIKTDSDGKWNYTMDKELKDGKHEVYVAMTESAGKIIAKSDPIPFVKTAEAVTLQSDVVLANTSSAESENRPGFFRGGTMTLSLAVLFILLGLSFIVISFVSKKREGANQDIQSDV